jgi:hypothetical protein
LSMGEKPFQDKGHDEQAIMPDRADGACTPRPGQ